MTIAVLTAVLTGCGGPSDAEQARAERAWSAKAVEICQFIGAEMTSRGKAGDINDIERYATETTGLLLETTRDVERIPVREGAERHAEEVLDALHGSDPRLRDLREAARSGDEEAAVRAADALAKRIAEIDPVVSPAGLRACWGGDWGERIRRGIRAPVWGQGAATAAARLSRSLRPVLRTIANGGSPQVISRGLADAAGVAREVADEFERLPADGVVDDGELRRRTLRLAAVADAVAAELGRPSAPAVKRPDPRVRRLVLAVVRQRAELQNLLLNTDARVVKKAGADDEPA